MTSPVGRKEVLAHLFKNMLELHSDDITALKDLGGLWNYKKLHVTSINFLKKLYKSEHITLAAFQYLSYSKMYVHGKQYTTYADIMLMTCNTWVLVNLPLF